ncbi:hypothetical protein OS493_034342 [Desmophyllum pertusum]|uniref:Secreted protein n=1 Tax=Desmophyllum pertusum TaxID=174260 RepID=A0A9W9Y7X9_9CNID|nr:hypothetical protein OS493_034342 [Desmophyllum pertusum]
MKFFPLVSMTVSLTILVLFLCLVAQSYCLQSAGSVESSSKIQNCDLLTFEEKPCTTMRTGMVRSTTGQKYLDVCSKEQWQPYYPQCDHGCYNNRVAGLIGHWRMDEQTGNEVADDSGNENHGSASGPVPKLSKFSRGRYFDSDGIITVPGSTVLNFAFQASA